MGNTIHFIVFPTFTPCQMLQPRPFRTLQALLIVSSKTHSAWVVCLKLTKAGIPPPWSIMRSSISLVCSDIPRQWFICWGEARKTSPLPNTCTHTFINWLKYSVTSQWGMVFPPPSPMCSIQFPLLFDKCVMTHYLPRSAALGSFVKLCSPPLPPTRYFRNKSCFQIKTIQFSMGKGEET